MIDKELQKNIKSIQLTNYSYVFVYTKGIAIGVKVVLAVFDGNTHKAMASRFLKFILNNYDYETLKELVKDKKADQKFYNKLYADFKKKGWKKPSNFTDKDARYKQ